MWKVPESSVPLFGGSRGEGILNSKSGEGASKALFPRSGLGEGLFDNKNSEGASKPLFGADSLGYGLFNNKNGATSKPLFGDGLSEGLLNNKNGATSKPLFGADRLGDGLFNSKNGETSKPLFGAESLGDGLFNNKNGATSKPLFRDSLGEGLFNNKNDETSKPLFGAESLGDCLFNNKNGETSKPLFGGDSLGEGVFNNKNGATSKPLFGDSLGEGLFNNKNGEPSKPLFGDSLGEGLLNNKNGETSKPLFGADSFGDGLFNNKNGETSKPLFGGDSLGEGVFNNKNGATSKPLFGDSLGEGVFNNKNGETSKPLFGGDSLGEGLFNNKNDDASKPLFGSTGNFLPTFTFKALSYEVTNENKKVKLSKNPNASPLIEKRFYHKKQLLSLVYKCTACGLSFDRLEVISQHLSYCLPLKKITRIHCVCGLEFDTHNYKYHCVVHREFNALKKKDVTIINDVIIDVETMANKFIHDTKHTVGAAADKYKIKSTASNDKPVNRVIKFLPKTCMVYRCKCKLCFEKLELMFNHLNKCDPNEKITRVLCMCGLEFDMHNYDHHCEVHRKYAMLHVKKVTVKDDILIHISAMKTEFAENDEKVAKNTQDAQVQTDVNEPSVKPITERSFQANGTFEQLLGLKIVSAVIDTAVGGKENQAKITIIIEKETEKLAESPNKTNTDYRDDKVAENLKSKTTTCQPSADDTINGMTVRDHEGTASQEVSDIAPNENTAPTKPENEPINSSDSADGKTNEISEQIEQLNIEDHQRNSDTTTNETSAVTPATSANKPIDNPESTDIGSHENTTLNDGYNKINNDHEKIEILTNGKAVTPSISANKAIDGRESTDIRSYRDTTQIDGYKINNNQENSDISNENNASIEPENKADVGLKPLEDLKVIDITTKHTNVDNSKLYSLW